MGGKSAGQRRKEQCRTKSGEAGAEDDVDDDVDDGDDESGAGEENWLTAVSA
jgi:hypothetical protein